MRRLHNVLVAFSFFAALAAPAVAQAQPGDRPATQLFMAPTGRALPKGQGYFKGLALAVPSWQGGLTDRLSVGIGIPIFGLGRAVIVTPKFQIQHSQNHSTSVGAVGVLTTDGSGEVGYVAHTFELSNGALHVAAMAPLSRASDGVVVMIGAERRLNDHVTLMTENYLIGRRLPIVSGGFRLKAPHTTWDFGLLVPVGFPYGARPAPMINGGWKF